MHKSCEFHCKLNVFFRDTCEELFKVMKPKEKTLQKMLHAPVNIAEMAADMENNISDMKSIWVINRDLSNVSTAHFV